MNKPSLIEYIFFAGMAVAVSFCVLKALKATKKNKKVDIYNSVDPYANSIKIVLQMFVGFGLALLIILKLLYRLQFDFICTLFPSISSLIKNLPTLEIIGFALIYSTAIELAYTLFTDGPDEAVNPLITGLAGAILIGISDSNNFNIKGIVTIALAVVILAGLFTIQKIFIEPFPTKRKRDEKSQNEEK